MQELADRAIADMHGTHFDIPEQVRRIECCLAPTSDGGIYYTGPSEDFTRPGRMWWAVPPASTLLDLAGGDHGLPRGCAGSSPAGRPDRGRSDQLNRWRGSCLVLGTRRGLGALRGTTDGGAGYLDDPGERMGMLDAQAMRAARVVVDIGMHLELDDPQRTTSATGRDAFHPGERFTPELGWEFMRAHCSTPTRTCASS
jgi:uncharacterized protein (DUF885 family)